MDSKEEKTEKSALLSFVSKWHAYQESSIDLVEDQLFLSGSGEAKNYYLLRSLDIKHILSVLNFELKNGLESITYKRIDAIDYHSQDLLTYFPETNKFIADAQESGQNVLVHCQAGISRSSTVVIAFLMNKYEISYESALKTVLKSRFVRPNFGFVSQLKLYQQMGFTLDANNPQMRQHLIRTILVGMPSVWNPTKFNPSSKFNDYLERRHLIEGMTYKLDLGKKCLCVECGQHLFNEKHILENPQNICQEPNPCKGTEWTYIEPQKWMTQLSYPSHETIETVIKCPKCGQQLVEFRRGLAPFSCEKCVHSDHNEESFCFRIASDKYFVVELD